MFPSTLVHRPVCVVVMHLCQIQHLPISYSIPVHENLVLIFHRPHRSLKREFFLFSLCLTLINPNMTFSLMNEKKIIVVSTVKSVEKNNLIACRRFVRERNKTIVDILFPRPMYSSGRYSNSSTNNNTNHNHSFGPALTLSDSDNRDPIASAILKASSNQSFRGKSPVANPMPLPTHSYYTRSKSVREKSSFCVPCCRNRIFRFSIFSLIPNIEIHQEREREKKKIE